MKRKIKNVGFALMTGFVAGSIFISCQSDNSKLQGAKEEVNEARQELDEIQNKANAKSQKVAEAEEWKAFKVETNMKIKENEIRILELKEKMNSSGKTMDSFYQKRIEKLEENNNVLKARLDAYEKDQSDWESFKREFNHDMDELGHALKDFNVNNKK